MHVYIYIYMRTHIVSVYYRTTRWMFMKLCRDGPHMCLCFFQIRPGVDTRQGKKDSKRASKTKCFTWNAVILVVVSARYSKG